VNEIPVKVHNPSLSESELRVEYFL
jgi:hypothetical protein